MNLLLCKSAFTGTVGISVILQFTFTCFITYRTIKRMIDKQKFITAFLAASAFCDDVCTTIPSAARVAQAIASLGIFSISTRHILQLPETERLGCQQKLGISIPFLTPACIIVSPCVNSISFLSKTNLGMSILK